MIALGDFFPKARVLGAGPSPSSWPPPPGDALPAFPAVTSGRGSQQVWASAPYATALPKTPPAIDAYEYRGGFCDTQDPTAPVVYGGNADFPDRVMAMLLMNYPEDFAARFVERQLKLGYQDIQVSVWHFRYLHPSSGALSVKNDATHAGHLLWPLTIGRDRSAEAVRATLAAASATVASLHALAVRARTASLSTTDRLLDQFIPWCKQLQSWGMRTDLWWSANDVQDGGRAYYEPELDAWLKAVVADKAANAFGVGWQLDRSNSPRSLQELIEYLSPFAKQLGIKMRPHTLNDACAWWDSDGMPAEQTIASMGGPQHQNITNRFAWWNLNRDYLDGGAHVQLDALEAPVNELQDATGALLRTCPVDIFEINAQPFFDGVMDMAHARMKGRLVCATPPRDFSIIGYGNGGGQAGDDPAVGGAL